MRKHLTPGTVLGTVAVVFACTGSATAGALITSNSIKDGTIQAPRHQEGHDLFGSARVQRPHAAREGRHARSRGSGRPGRRDDDGAGLGPDGRQGRRAARMAPRGAGRARTASTRPRSSRPTARPVGSFVGGGGASPYPTASFSGGELRLQGGFDGTTPSGAIGIVRAGNDVPLSSLKTLSYDFRLIKRPAGSVVAPTIHVSVLKANTGQTSGFTNFVFEPYIQGDFGLNQRYSLDAMAGKWWSTRNAGGINQSNPATWADVIAKNPDATISAISVDNGGSSGNTIPADQFAAGVDNVIVGFGTTSRATTSAAESLLQGVVPPVHE